jgi:hypothetical protein
LCGAASSLRKPIFLIDRSVDRARTPQNPTAVGISWQ